MKALDKQAWAAAHNSEYLGFKQQKVFKIVKPEPGVRIHDTLTRLEYKEDNGEFLKYKVLYAQVGTNKNLESASRDQIYMLRCSRRRRRDYCWLLQQQKGLRS